MLDTSDVHCNCTKIRKTRFSKSLQIFVAGRYSQQHIYFGKYHISNIRKIYSIVLIIML